MHLAGIGKINVAALKTNALDNWRTPENHNSSHKEGSQVVRHQGNNRGHTMGFNLSLWEPGLVKPEWAGPGPDVHRGGTVDTAEQRAGDNLGRPQYLRAVAGDRQLYYQSQ